MTDKRELGEMLITDKPIQCISSDDSVEAYWGTVAGLVFDLGRYNYRLKPTTTYYRVFISSTGDLCVRGSTCQFVDFNSWTDESAIHILDFEKEES